jgi:hypothetical protein
VVGRTEGLEWRVEFKLKGSVGLLKLEGAEGQLSGFIHRSLAGCLGGASAAESGALMSRLSESRGNA